MHSHIFVLLVLLLALDQRLLHLWSVWWRVVENVHGHHLVLRHRHVPHTLPATLHILAGSGAGVQQIPAPARQGHAQQGHAQRGHAQQGHARQGYHYHTYHYQPRCVLQCTTTHIVVTVVHRDGRTARHRTLVQTFLCRVLQHRLTTHHQHMEEFSQ